jgi:hypothetical protein
MNRRKLFFILLAACLSAAAVPKKPEELRPAPAFTIRLGEKLQYKITWLGIPVGTGEVWVKEKIQFRGREVFHVVGMVETNKVLRRIFPVHDEAHSWIDAVTFESLQFEKKIDELILNTRERMTFYGEEGKAIFKSLKNGTENEFKIQRPVHDVLSAFYWARRQPLAPGDSARVTLIADQKKWELTVRAVKKEKVKLDGIKVSTLRVEPETVIEGEEKKGKAWFNVTTDASQVPVRVVYKAPFGRMVGTLQQPVTERES